MPVKSDGKRSEKEPCEHQSQGRRGERAEAVSPAVVERNDPHCSPSRTPSAADEYLLKKTVDHGQPMQEQVHPEGLQPMGRTHTGVKEEWKEEGAEETYCGLTGNPCSTSAVHFSAWGGSRRAEKESVEYFGLEKEGRWRTRFLIFVFIS